MKKRGFYSRALSLALCLIMVLSLVPWAQLKVAAAIGDLSQDPDYNFDNSSFDYNDTINLPIQIYDYANDGMLFEYLLGETGSYTHETDYWIDYTTKSDAIAGGKLSNMLWSDCGSYLTKSHETAVSNDARWVNYVNKLNRRVAFNVGKFLDDDGVAKANKDVPETTDIDSIRYFVIAYRSPSALASPGFAISNKITTQSDGLAKADESDGHCSGFYNFTSGTNQWEYAIIDLKGKYDAETNSYSGIVEDVYNLYLILPMTKTGEEIDISCFGFFDNYGDAEQYGQYGVTIGSTRTSGATYNNACFGFLIGDATGVDNADTWIGNQIANGKFTADQNVHFLTREGNDTVTGATYLTYWDGQYTKNGTTYTEDIGYDLRMTFEELTTVGLLESSLSEDGLPVYKKSVVMYLATYLRNRRNQGRYDSNGWQNYDYVTGSSEWFSKDLDGDGQIDANEQYALFEAICELCSSNYFGVNSSGSLDKTDVGNSTAANLTAYYNNSMEKFYSGQLQGDWFKCKDNIKCWTDAAVYLLHNLFVPDSYNKAQDTYYYIVLPSAYDNTTKSRTYVFDAGLTNVVGATTDNATLSNTKSAVVYKSNGTISLSGVDSKFMIQYDSAGRTTTRFPFLPVHTTAGDASSQNETDSPYFTDSGVTSTADYGETYLDRNYNYTLASQGQFVYFEDQDYYFNFEGDDDVYLFINGELVLDLGATHGISRAKININDYVNWAQDNLSSSDSGVKARAEKLNLVDGESYRFDFFYMERHGTGANLKISTNIPVTDPAMGTDKKAYQNGVEIPNAGVADPDKLVEYAFSITNDTSVKLYNFEFVDENLGVELRYNTIADDTSTEDVDESRSYFTPGDALNAQGEPLQVTDLVAYIDGYDEDGNKVPTIMVTFNNELELRDFLKNLTADGTESGEDGTEDGVSNTGQSGAGLWEGSTLTFRGIYANLNRLQSNGRYTNTLTVKAYSSAGIQFLGEDTHRVYTSSEPSFFQWAGKRLNITKEEIYNGVMNSSYFSVAEKSNISVDAGSLKMALCREDGSAYTYTDVKVAAGNNVINVYYSTVGAHLFFVKLYNEMDADKHLIVPITVHTIKPEDDVLVLDYGLSSILSNSASLIDDVGLKTSGGGTKVSVMAYQDLASPPSYLLIPDFVRLEPSVGSYSKSTSSFTDAHYSLNKEVLLEWEKPWTIEFEGRFQSGIILLSDTPQASTKGNTYIHINSSCIFLGYADGKYRNSGVSWEIIAGYISGFDYTDYHEYRLVNRPNVDGTSNMVYLYVDGVEVGPMNQDIRNGNSTTTDANDISKKDFTFNYLGTNGDGLGLSNCDLNYLKIWEDGDLATVNRWTTSGGKLVSTTTDDNVYNHTVLAGTEDESATSYISKDSYSFEKTIALYHDKEWTIRWKANLTGNSLLFASTQYSASQNMPFIYVTTDAEILLGYYDYTANDGDDAQYGSEYINYGFAAPAGTTKTGKHTFRLTNKVNSDGTNMIHVYMDGVELGTMNTAFDAGTSLGKTDNWISCKDFFFSYFGTSDCSAANSPDGSAKAGHQVTGSIDFIEVDTGISYCEPDLYLDNYKNNSGQLLDMLCCNINNNRVSASNVGDSAQTVFDDTANGNGTFTVDEAGQLTYQPNTMNGWSNSLYLVMTVHKTDFTPSPVGPSGDDYRIDIANEVQVYKKLTVIPANVVYYEDDFPAISYITQENNINSFTKLGNGSQNLDQSSNQDDNYGSDHTYSENDAEISGDTTHKVKIDQHGALAYFQFTGTGFELISRTNALDSGSIYLSIYTGDVAVNDGIVSVEQDALVQRIPVITQFDNYDDLGDEGIYQVPVIRWSNETDVPQTYTVVISGVPGYDYAEDGTSTLRDTYLYLDGIRVYQPLGSSNEHYQDVESGASFVELRDKIVNGYIGAAEYDGVKVTVSTSTTSWTENHTGSTVNEIQFEGNEVASVDDYLIMGPNNEVYMDGTFTSSAIVLYVKETGSVHNLQIAVRALDYGEFIGAGKTFENITLQYGVKIGDTYGWLSLAATRSSTEQYFTIPYTECPVTADGCYQVAIRVAPTNDYTPAFASFSTLKLNGLELMKFADNGELATIAYQMYSDRVFSAYEAERDDDFAVETPAEGVPAIIPQSPSLSFESEVWYNVYFTLQNVAGITTEDMGLITFDSALADGTISEAVDVFPGAAYIDGEYVVRTDGIAAKNMGDTLYFKIYVKQADGTYLYSDILGYSAKTYAYNRLEKSSSEELKALCVAMLNYGAAAQEAFGYKTDSLMNADLTTEQKALVKSYDASMMDAVVSADSTKTTAFPKNESAFTGMSSTVSFEGAFSINYYFTPAHTVDDYMVMYWWDAQTYASAEALTKENACGAQIMAITTGTEYWGVVEEIAAKQIDETVYVAGVYTSGGVEYTTGVLAYSLAKYCTNIAADNTSDTQELAAATAVYGYYAKNYFGS